MADTTTSTTVNNASTTPSVETPSVATDTKTTTTPTTETPKVEAKPEYRSVIGDAFDELQAKKEKEDKEDVGGKRKVAVPPAIAKPNVATSVAAVVPEDIDPLTGVKLEVVKAPQALPAVLREKWASMPRDFQKYYAQRELDMAQNMSKLGADSKFAKEIQKYGEDIKPILEYNKINLGQFTQRAFIEMKALIMGNPQQKAVILANLIKQYQPDGPTLRAVIEGKPVNVPQQQQPINIDQEVEKRIAKQRETETQTSMGTAIEAFKSDPANEFAGDLENQMASAITGGYVVTDGKSPQEILKVAYDFAVKNHPEISQIVVQRAGNSGNTTTTTKPNAVPVKPIRSAKPSPGGGKPSNVPQKKYKNLREAASDAYDELMANR